MMKKFTLMLVLLLSACSVSNISNILNDNKNCKNISKFEVFQALDDGALAHECTFEDGCSAFNQIVFIENQLNVDYYDGMTITPTDEKCFVYDGVYKYTSKDERLRTIPFVRFEYKNEPKSEEELNERINETQEGIYINCLKEFEKNNEIQDNKLCKCISNEIIYFILENKDSADWENLSEEFFKTDIPKKCGKLPKFLM